MSLTHVTRRPRSWPDSKKLNVSWLGSIKKSQITRSWASRGMSFRGRGRDPRYYFSGVEDEAKDFSLLLGLFEDNMRNSSEFRPFPQPFQVRYFWLLFFKVKDETRRRILPHSSAISRLRRNPLEPQSGSSRRVEEGLGYWFGLQANHFWSTLKDITEKLL